MLITSDFETFISIKNIQIKSRLKIEQAFILYVVHNFKVGISLEIVLTKHNLYYIHIQYNTILGRFNWNNAYACCIIVYRNSYYT